MTLISSGSPSESSATPHRIDRPATRRPERRREDRAAPPFQYQGASEFLIDALANAYYAEQSVSITWLNHYSARHALAEPSTRTFDLVGVDGKLFQFILAARHRTSADLVLPRLLPRLNEARVVLVGGSTETLQKRQKAVEALLHPNGAVVLALDGYADLPPLDAFEAKLAECDANIVIVALGAGLQEAYAARAKRAFQSGGISATCGGLLDQLLTPGYYPRWAYPLKLNWLVRLAREPRRLWRRYTLDAFYAVATAGNMRRRSRALRGLWP